jgi:hypothetical protein
MFLAYPFVQRPRPSTLRPFSLPARSAQVAEVQIAGLRFRGNTVEIPTRRASEMLG